MTERVIKMHRTHTIDGVTLSFRRSIVGWVACFGPDRCVHFRRPIKGGVWVAKRPMALEPLATGPTLDAVVRLVKARYDAEDRELAERLTARRRRALAGDL